jgi:hypothetical protein
MLGFALQRLEHFEMSGFIRRHSGVVQDCAGAAGAISLAVYAHELDVTGFHALGLWNVAILAPILFFALYAIARRVEGTSAPQDKTASIHHTLEAMVRGYVFPESWEQNQYRAYCHRIDKKGSFLTPVAVAAPLPDVAERTSLPVTGSDSDALVVAKAFKGKRVVIEQVEAPPDDLDIWAQVKTVAAVPILDVDTDIALGTISIDTSLSKTETNFANNHTAAVLLNAAKAVALLWHNSPSMR